MKVKDIKCIAVFFCTVHVKWRPKTKCDENSEIDFE